MNKPSKNNTSKGISRRAAIQGVGTACSISLLGTGAVYAGQKDRKPVMSSMLSSPTWVTLSEKVNQTVFIDTHEHIFDEHFRLSGPLSKDDWTALLKGYPDSDMLSAGMPKADVEKFFAPGLAPKAKWDLLEPYWPAIKNTGYVQAVRLGVRELYGVDDISAETVEAIESGYQGLQKKGFYQMVLDKAKVESCHVNHILSPTPYAPSSQYPKLLRQDIGAPGMIMNPGQKEIVQPTGIEVKTLEDWHRVIDWWFEKYGHAAVAVKSQHAYMRDLNHDQVDTEAAAPIFAQVIDGQPVSAEDKKRLEDHLFWYVVKKATSYHLPFKLHTGYYAGVNQMPLSRVSGNPGSATDICRLGPDDRFVFMHICYPYYEAMIAAVKHYTNAYIDMCWSWIINPVSAKEFLKKYLVTAPANKILTFGGDYGLPEQTVGHAIIARQGITWALAELVEEGYMNLSEAMDLVDPIMHGNARQIFKM